MGRPPIGKIAMTGAERTRLYRLKHGTAKHVTKPVTKSASTDDAVASLEARIRELEAELARECIRREAGETRIAELEAIVGSKPEKPEPATKPEPDRRDEKITGLKARIAELETAGKPDDSARGVAELAQARARIAELEAKLAAAHKAENDPARLPKTSREKYDAMVRRLNREFDARVKHYAQQEVRRRIDEVILPHWREKIAEAQRIYGRRRGVISKTTFNLIWSALHPDSRKAISDERLAQAFDAFTAIEKHLLDEKDSPTPFPDLPDNLAAWDKMKAQHRKHRNTGKTVVRSR
jgi:hypothetical protein